MSRLRRCPSGSAVSLALASAGCFSPTGSVSATTTDASTTQDPGAVDPTTSTTASTTADPCNRATAMLHHTTTARSLALLAALALLRPPMAQAAVGPPSTTSQQLAAFESGFTEGQEMFDRGEYLAAARVWISAAGNLSEVTANRDNRLAVYEYVVDAYTRGLVDTTAVEPLREAVAALDAYCDGFTRAYGTETPLSPKIVAGLEELRRRLIAARSRTGAAPPLPRDPIDLPLAEEPAPVAKPWKGLAIGGGVLLGLGVGAVALAAAGAARGNSFEAKFDDPSHACDLAAPTGACAEFYDGGKASNAMAVAGLIAAPLLIGGGVALLVVGLRRRAGGRHAIAPRLGPGFVGVGWQGRF